ncbi:hypothetical protein D9M72_547950 [compost metagenome]
MIDRAVLAFLEGAQSWQFLMRVGAFDLGEIVGDLAACQFVRRKGDVVIMVEAVALRRDPGEVPIHALPVGFDLRQRRIRCGDQRHVVVVEVWQHAGEVVDQEGAAGAAGLPGGAEHEMVDNELTATVEQFGQRLAPGHRVENVGLFHFHPGQSQPGGIDLVACVGVFLFKREQCFARFQPLPRRYDCVVLSHARSSFQRCT